MENQLQTPGEIIRKTRESLGLTQQEFAALLNAGRSTIANYEAGRCQPSSEILLRVLHLRDANIEAA